MPNERWNRNNRVGWKFSGYLVNGWKKNSKINRRGGYLFGTQEYRNYILIELISGLN